MIADDDPAPWNDAEAAEVAAGLRDLARGRIAELRDVLDRLPDPLPSWLAQAEADAMLPRAEDALLLRYETQRSREFHRALGDLTRMAQSGSDLVAVEEAEEDVPAESEAEKPSSTPSTPRTSEELASVGNPPSSPTEPRPSTTPATAAEPGPRVAGADPGPGLGLRSA